MLLILRLRPTEREGSVWMSSRRFLRVTCARADPVAGQLPSTTFVNNTPLSGMRCNTSPPDKAGRRLENFGRTYRAGLNFQYISSSGSSLSNPSLNTFLTLFQHH
jgi:hypothetical protein